MRLFAYYAIHSFFNSLRKLFKSWIAAFIIICFLIGIVGGLIAAAFSSDSEEAEPENIQIEAEMSDAGYQTGGEESKEDSGFLAQRGLTRFQLIEMIVSVAVLVIVFLNIINTDGASKIFKPADIPLLFASPLKPQSVMLFRLFGSLGVMFLASLYMLAQVPNFVENMGLSIWGAFSLILAYTISLITGMLLQVTLYTVASRHPVLKRNMSKLVGGFFILIVVGFALYTNFYGGDLLTSAVRYFAAPATRFVPFWGWTRGFCAAAIEGQGIQCLIYGLLIIVGFVALIVLIWNLDADFYEDAMESSEKMTELMEKSKNGTATNRKKDRSDKLLRDGMKHGYGANVFFWKSMYNRFRFATLHVFTKTFITYLAVALIGSYFCAKITEFNGFIIVACVIALLAFYRTLGNPLQEDTSKEFFVMIPETAGIKLLWSLLAGSVNCLMDVLIPLIIAAVWMKTGIVSAIMWTLFIVTIDYFGTTVGAFIGISVPVNAGQTIKTLVQILFLYFGIAPAAAFVIIGIVSEKLVLFMTIAILVNLTVGSIFFALTPKYLENGNR